jgi:hypothetical protein
MVARVEPFRTWTRASLVSTIMATRNRLEKKSCAAKRAIQCQRTWTTIWVVNATPVVVVGEDSPAQERPRSLRQQAIRQQRRVQAILPTAKALITQKRNTEGTYRFVILVAMLVEMLTMASN